MIAAFRLKKKPFEDGRSNNDDKQHIAINVGHNIHAIIYLANCF